MRTSGQNPTNIGHKLIRVLTGIVPQYAILADWPTFFDALVKCRSRLLIGQPIDLLTTWPYIRRGGNLGSSVRLPADRLFRPKLHSTWIVFEFISSLKNKCFWLFPKVLTSFYLRYKRFYRSHIIIHLMIVVCPYWLFSVYVNICISSIWAAWLCKVVEATI